MGYLTHHTIKISPFSQNLLHDVLNELNKDGEYFEIDEEEINSEYFKWYTCDDDVLKISKKFPTITITMDVTGEDGERWTFVCRNGVQLDASISPNLEEIKDLARQSLNNCLDAI